MYDAILAFLRIMIPRPLMNIRGERWIVSGRPNAWWLTNLTHRFNDDFEQRMKELNGLSRHPMLAARWLPRIM